MEEQGQLNLFPTTVQEVLSRLSLFPSQVELLYREGLLSFQPELSRTLLPSEKAELVFVGELAANSPTKTSSAFSEGSRVRESSG